MDVTRDQAPADLSPKILIRYYGQVRRAAPRSYTPPISAQLPAAVCSCVVLIIYLLEGHLLWGSGSSLDCITFTAYPETCMLMLTVDY